MVWWKRKPETFELDGDGSKGWLKYGSNLKDVRLIATHEVINIYVAEHDLRDLVQREEALKHQVKAMEKAASIDVDFDVTQLKNIKNQLQEIPSKLTMKEYQLYRAESYLTPSFEIMYRNLRLNPKWYMRPEMVQDCSDRGGCCSRGCGCCENRLLSKRKKGRGHCTTECLCCANFLILSDEQKKYIKDDLKKRLEDTKSRPKFQMCLAAKMSNWNFCPLDTHRWL